jgi:hypothetical protein
MSVETTIKGDAAGAVSWLQRHERIVIVALVLLAGTYFGQKYLNVKAANDHDAAVVAVQALNDAKAQNTAFAAKIDQLNGQYQNLQVQLSQENIQLASTMANRVTILHEQQAAIKTMPLPDVAVRWSQLTNTQPAEITQTLTGLNVSDTAARATVSELERVPVLEANLKDEKSISDNKTTELNKANELIDGLHTQVTGLNTTIVAEENASKAELAAAKSAANKSKSKWFKVGFGLGFGLGFITGHKL